MKNDKTGDQQRKNRANLHAVFRGVVSVYLLVLAVRTVRGVYQSATSMPVWAAWLAGLAFSAAAIGFGVYAWKRYRRESAGENSTV